MVVLSLKGSLWRTRDPQIILYFDSTILTVSNRGEQLHFDGRGCITKKHEVLRLISIAICVKSVLYSNMPWSASVSERGMADREMNCHEGTVCRIRR